MAHKRRLREPLLEDKNILWNFLEPLHELLKRPVSCSGEVFEVFQSSMHLQTLRSVWCLFIEVYYVIIGGNQAGFYLKMASILPWYTVKLHVWFSRADWVPIMGLPFLSYVYFATDCRLWNLRGGTQKGFAYPINTKRRLFCQIVRLQ